MTDQVHKKMKKTPFMNDDAEVPLLDNTIPVDVNNNDMQYNPWQEDPASVPENVDFKYMTELIHRVDLKNKTNDLLPPIEYNPLDSIEVYQPKVNKNYYQYYDTPLNAFEKRRSNRNNDKQPDDSYYTNLGRQIATMIRGIDAQNKQVNIEMEKANDKLNTDPYFNKNSAQSFWERSVRSPLTFLNANRNKFEYLKKSNEILFNIENRVEIMASTAPALSLQEIENIVKAMEAAKMDMQRKEINVGDIVPSNKNLDIKLWPQEFKISGKINRPELMKKDENINEAKVITNNNPADNDKTLRVQSVQKILNLPNQNPMENKQRARQIPEIKLIKNPSVGNTYFASDPLNYNQLRYGVANQRQTKTGALSQKPSAQLLLENEMNPLFLKHRKSAIDDVACSHMTSPAISKSPEKQKSDSKSPAHSTTNTEPPPSTPSNAEGPSTSSAPPSDPYNSHAGSSRRRQPQAAPPTGYTRTNPISPERIRSRHTIPIGPSGSSEPYYIILLITPTTTAYPYRYPYRSLPLSLRPPTK
ncbi:unnamed protein product [Danaus chrysippus]|uniref:(African queen) hypothetical protein n=1 Tax=Danaus chrysippus TaxID=151541 RepID=A0A8J2QK51_9NEOP|nr:unnamed protein product [Danaus chrysippus]